MKKIKRLNKGRRLKLIRTSVKRQKAESKIKTMSTQLVTEEVVREAIEKLKGIGYRPSFATEILTILSNVLYHKGKGTWEVVVERGDYYRNVVTCRNGKLYLSHRDTKEI